MKNSLIPISDIDFNNAIDIKFNNILVGFDLFKSFTINGNILDGESRILEFIEKTFEENSDNAYIDFYINRISQDDKNNLMNLILEDDKNVLKEIMKINHNGIYFKLTDKNLIPFFVRLSTREIFFVTFYFSKIPLTIWSNYNMTFPCFVDNDENLDHYTKLASQLDLLQSI